MWRHTLSFLPHDSSKQVTVLFDLLHTNLSPALPISPKLVTALPFPCCCALQDHDRCRAPDPYDKPTEAAHMAGSQQRAAL
jgi:hypothetical protein